MNEAPGPIEAEAGIPSYGLQGANIFHALRSSGIEWAVRHEKFTWPQEACAGQSPRHRRKESFLSDRRKNITCTNAFAQWPKPNAGSIGFCAPSDSDVLSEANLARIRAEVISSHRAILVCGLSAYLACTGNPLLHASSRERSPLDEGELASLNARLRADFQVGWYMGHTRRWNFQSAATAKTLRSVAESVGWSVDADAA